MHSIRFCFLVLVAVCQLSGCGADHGTALKFNGGELFYTDAVTRDEADNLGRFLVEQEFFDGEYKSVQLHKDGATYQFRMVIKKGLEKDEQFIQIAKAFCAELIVHFGGEKVDIHLCDENLETLRVVVLM